MVQKEKLFQNTKLANQRVHLFVKRKNLCETQEHEQGQSSTKHHSPGDLSCKARDESNDAVLHDAVKAGNDLAAIFK